VRAHICDSTCWRTIGMIVSLRVHEGSARERRLQLAR
jgi:hypothetical protein